MDAGDLGLDSSAVIEMFTFLAVLLATSPGSPSYSCYRSMMSSYYGGSSMMGGTGTSQACCALQASAGQSAAADLKIH